MPSRSAVKKAPETPSARRPQRRAASVLEVEGRRMSLPNLDKVFYPATGFTKGQVIDYYARIAPALLPHMKDRPLTLKRYPDGVRGMFFYEKMCPEHRPPWVATTSVARRHREGSIRYCVVNDLPTLIWVAGLASIELHTLLSRAKDIDRPTSMVFDLDPGEGMTILDCIPVALRFRRILDDLHLQSFPKTSGGKGLHVYVPLNTRVTFDQTKELSHALARLLQHEEPKRVTSNMRKDLRVGRIFVDWSQNDIHKTTVCVYSMRAREHPTVSTPVNWDEVEAAGRSRKPQRLVFEATDVLRRMDKHGDLFAPVLELKQSLPSLAAAEVD